MVERDEHVCSLPWKLHLRVGGDEDAEVCVMEELAFALETLGRQRVSSRRVIWSSFHVEISWDKGLEVGWSGGKAVAGACSIPGVRCWSPNWGNRDDKKDSFTPWIFF